MKSNNVFYNNLIMFFYRIGIFIGRRHVMTLSNATSVLPNGTSLNIGVVHHPNEFLSMPYNELSFEIQLYFQVNLIRILVEEKSEMARYCHGNDCL